MFVLCRIKPSCSPPRWRRWLAALLFGALAGGLFPMVARAQYRFDNWTTDNGLPQNSVLAMTQTRDGYLWLATLDGLVRFDGVRFSVFNKRNTPQLPSNRLRALHCTADGALWIGTDQGLLRLQEGRFTTFSTSDGLPSNQIEDLQDDGRGGLLVRTQGGYAHWRSGRFVADAEAAGEDRVRLLLARDGTRWMLDQHGLHATGADRAWDYPLRLMPNSIRHARLYEDRRGALWICAPDGLFRVEGKQITPYSAAAGLPPSRVTAILEDRKGNLWLGTLLDGLAVFRDGRFTRYQTTDGLASNPITKLYEDREGSLWVGTASAGFTRVTPAFIQVYSTPEGLGGSLVSSILEDRQGAVWLGLGGGLTKWANGRFTNYTRAQGLPFDSIITFYEDHAGRLWLGGGQGLCQFQNGHFGPLLEPLKGSRISAIVEDQQGALWVGTEYGSGLAKVEGEQVSFYTTRDGLPDNRVMVLHIDRQGRLWLGTEGGLGLYEQGRFTSYTVKDGLTSNRIWALHEDEEGQLWIGTLEGGLCRFKEGRFNCITPAQGLFDQNVFQIVDDALGNFWLGCHRGLYRVSKEQLNAVAAGRREALTCAAYGRQDGLRNTGMNGGHNNVGLRLRDGRLLFATGDGVALVDPRQVSFNPNPPYVVIEAVKIDNAETAGGVEVRIQPGQANLEIRYTGLSFIKPEQLHFRYKLVGQDQNWIEAGARRTANYSYLPPGGYTFQVLAANSDGVWNNQGAQLQVVVLPAFYQTWWFRALALLALLGLAFTAYRWRIRQLRREQQKQVAFSRQLIEAHESERGRLAGELHDSLGQDLLVIKNWALVGLTTTEEDNSAREMLSEIAEATSHAIEDCREISHNLRPLQLDFVGLTEALRGMINRVANSSSLRIEAHLDDLTGVLPKEAEINLYRIVQESLNNIVKHARASRVKIAVRRELAPARKGASRITVRIEDDGRGFDPAALANGKRGLGLSSITERTRMLGGEVVIDSAPGRGTSVTVTIDSL
ncbi:MAG: two-component regulator propeller domain-containing protein [Acidobacteriota bacterium]